MVPRSDRACSFSVGSLGRRRISVVMRILFAGKSGAGHFGPLVPVALSGPVATCSWPARPVRRLGHRTERRRARSHRRREAARHGRAACRCRARRARRACAEQAMVRAVTGAPLARGSLPFGVVGPGATLSRPHRRPPTRCSTRSASRARRSGTSPFGTEVPSRTRDPDGVRADVRAVLDDPRYPDGARRIARAIQALPPIDHAVHALTALAAGQTLAT